MRSQFIHCTSPPENTTLLGKIYLQSIDSFIHLFIYLFIYLWSILTVYFLSSSMHLLYFCGDTLRNMQGNIERGYRIKSEGRPSVISTRNRSQAYLQADEKFFWNLNVSMPFIERDLGTWTTPFANIWTETKTFTQNHRKYNLTLVSRRGSRRQGPRYIKRGVDKNGDVANFVETEQILRGLDSTNGDVFAFTQIRGSIPLYWEQIETWRLKPPISPDLNLTSQYTPLGTHVSAMCSDYCSNGKVGDKGGKSDDDDDDDVPDMVFVNLIDKKGMQGALGACLSKALKGLQKNSNINLNRDEKALLNRNITTVEISRIQDTLIEHIWFDYHNKCSGGKTSSLGELMPLLDPISIGSDGYLHINKHGKILKKQNKIIRSNCIDCLDRTNVVQSNIARRVLQHQLSIVSNEPFFKSIPSSSSPSSRNRQQIDDYANFIPPFREESLEISFRELWGDNGDNLSMLYAGTRALKRDVTRKGKRTRQGLFDDGVNSAKRYFINNFKDPRYQRALDIILGGDIYDTSSEKLEKLRQALRFKKVPGKRADLRPHAASAVTSDDGKEVNRPVKKKNVARAVAQTGISKTTVMNNRSSVEMRHEDFSTNATIIDFDPKEIKHKTMAVGKKKRGEADDQLSNFKEQVTNFYQKYNPSKIADVPSILQKYQGNEKQLLEKLKRKYITIPSRHGSNNDIKMENERSKSSIEDDNREKRRQTVAKEEFASTEKLSCATDIASNDEAINSVPDSDLRGKMLKSARKIDTDVVTGSREKKGPKKATKVPSVIDVKDGVIGSGDVHVKRDQQPPRRRSHKKSTTAGSIEKKLVESLSRDKSDLETGSAMQKYSGEILYDEDEPLRAIDDLFTDLVCCWEECVWA